MRSSSSPGSKPWIDTRRWSGTDYQQLAGIEALTQRPLRIRLQPTQGDQLDAHDPLFVNGQGSQLPIGVL